MDGTENARASRSKSSHNNLSSSIRSSLSRTTRRMDDVFAGASRQSGSSTRVAEEEEALRRAAIEKLPTYDRLGTRQVLKLPTVEVRLEHLNIEADTYRGSRALPTLPKEAAELALGVATAIEGAESSLATDYIFKVLGLDICKGTVVGNEMNRGVSGGQKKRITTG
ncbi:PREDICTED: pleiotropic drug resistance protein 1 [Theobroma cacao]|uniref:Pleiotropic drug resistance protein 1 n=1 Tax=Theobroma cacao TaxID=3641 RepID=A0AB32W4Y8_THECC|nr:PREDICTED: pleiotropic drug resistance protein 1 [Theobroma cacao]